MGGTILVVEDDEPTRELIVEVLAAEGFTLLAAEHPEAALELVRASGTSIDLVITDVVMRHMSGFEMVKQMASSHDSLRVLFMSGYSDQILANQGEFSAKDALLRKPFGIDALKHNVREVLAEHRPYRNRQSPASVYGVAGYAPIPR